MLKIKVLITLGIAFLATISWLGDGKIQAKEYIEDWYIKEFRSEITVNQDSSLDIVEYITADCGDLPDKHGIFRVLPLTHQITADQKERNPVKLIGITDFSGRPYNFSQSINHSKQTLSWRIGDPNQEVQ